MRSWNPFGSGRSEQEMQEEFEDHLRARIEDLVLSGVDRESAEMQARREFGSVALTKEECREAWPLAWVRTTGLLGETLSREPWSGKPSTFGSGALVHLD